MYDVVFRCSECGVHLSASPDDAGYIFNCPQCNKSLEVPAGDILFSCKSCSHSLLASHDTIGHEFECPHCQSLFLVPAEGKQIEIHQKAQPIPDVSTQVEEVLQSNPLPPVDDLPMDQQEINQNHHFMSTWGDYIAQAGLIDGKKKKTEEKRT